jgi:hypothetical protein
MTKVKISKNFYSQSIKDIGILGRTSILFIIPFIFTWVMFNPLDTFDLKPNTTEPQDISLGEINKNLTPFILANFFQTTLGLGWYKVCFENTGALTINGHVVSNREDRGDVQVRVKQGAFSASMEDYQILTARPFEKTDCLRFSESNGGLTISTSTISLGAPMNDIPQDRNMVSQSEYEFSFMFDYEKVHLYIQQDEVAFWVKYAVMLVAWGSLLLLFAGLWEWLLKKGI